MTVWFGLKYINENRYELKLRLTVQYCHNNVIFGNTNESEGKSVIREKTKDDVSPVSPPIVKTNGKPGVEYESLFEEWIRSGMDRENFLMAYGLNPKSSAVSDKTKTWTRDVQQAQRKIVRSKRNERSTKSRPQREIAEMWQIVQGWRTGQAEKDWEMAEKLRLHLALQLDSGIKTDRKTGE